MTRSTLKQERPQRISERSLPSPPAFVPSPGFSQTAGHRQWQRRFPKPAFRDPLAEIPRINAINRSRPIRPKSETDSLRKTVVFVVANKATNRRTARTVREFGKSQVEGSYGIRKISTEVFDLLVASPVTLNAHSSRMSTLRLKRSSLPRRAKPIESNRCQREETAPSTGTREHDVRP